MSPPTKILVGYVPGIPGGVDAYGLDDRFTALRPRYDRSTTMLRTYERVVLQKFDYYYYYYYYY